MLFNIGILVIFGLGCLIGWYKGFLNTLFNIISFFISWLTAFIFHTPLSSWLINIPDMQKNLLYFTAGTEKLSDMTVINVDTATLTGERIHDIIYSSDIPPHFASKLEYNVLNQTFADQGIYTMGEYFNQTFINLALSLLSFLIIYFVVRIICSFLIELCDKTFRFPVLKKADSPIGALFGIMYGFMIVTVIFSIIPLVFTIIDLPDVVKYMNESPIAVFFYSNNIISNIL